MRVESINRAAWRDGMFAAGSVGVHGEGEDWQLFRGCIGLACLNAQGRRFEIRPRPVRAAPLLFSIMPMS
jgi:hypothetical protein